MKHFILILASSYEKQIVIFFFNFHFIVENGSFRFTVSTKLQVEMID